MKMCSAFLHILLLATGGVLSIDYAMIVLKKSWEKGLNGVFPRLLYWGESKES